MMLAVFGLSFLLVAAVVEPAFSQDHNPTGDLSYKRLENRLDQLELKLQKTSDEQKLLSTNTNSLLEKIVNSLNVIQQQTSQMAVIKSCNEATTTENYQLRLPNRPAPIEVFCDMEELDGGGWLVIQQRLDGSVDFNRSWSEYRDGFGVVGQFSEFWLGLEAIRQLTKAGDHELLVQLKNETGHDGQARFERFQVSGGDDYTLSLVGGFPQTMEGMVPWEPFAIGGAAEGFSTYDRSSSAIETSEGYKEGLNFHPIESPRNKFLDRNNGKRSSESCAQKYGGGWWFYDCSHTNLNGPFKKDNNTGRGIFWKGWTDAATYSRMLIRRR